MTMPIRTYRIESNGNIDPITVFVDPVRPGSSRITIQCYATAYTAYWGAHGADTTVEQFFASCNDEYIVDNLLWGWGGRVKAKQEKFVRAHLTKIVQAIKEHLQKDLKS